MLMVPKGNEKIRTFLPSKDFDVSKDFYMTLGFDVYFEDDDVTIFSVGQSSFSLRHYYQKDWAENFMMQIMVDDLDAWWTHISSLDLANRFGVREPTAPAMQPWGLQIAYVVDPCGVLWHFAQNPDFALEAEH